MRTVFLEHARRRKLSELVSYHVLSYEHGVEDLPVVHEERVSNEVRSNHGAARPGFDRLLHACIVHLVDLFEEMEVDERPLLK